MGRGKGRCSSFEKPSSASVGGSSSGRFHLRGGADFGAEGGMQLRGAFMITISELKGWQTTSEVHDSVSRGEGLPRGKSRFILLKLIRSFDDYDPKGRRGRAESPCLRRCTTKFVLENPLRVIDAPTTARAVGLPPRGGQYFLSKRKKVPKKAGGTATTGKRLLLPILSAGLVMSRAP